MTTGTGRAHTTRRAAALLVTAVVLAGCQGARGATPPSVESGPSSAGPVPSVTSASTPTPTPEPTPSGPSMPVIGPSVPGEMRPAAEVLMDDEPDHYVEGCHQLRDEAEPEACVYGDAASDTLVVLVGDSHAAQWQPTLRVLAEERGWRLEVYTKSACPLADQQVWIRKDDQPYASCSEWNGAVLPTVVERSPDLVVTTVSGEYDAVVDGRKVDAGPEADRLIADGLVRTWRTIDEAGVPMLVLMDTPWYPLELHECLAENASAPHLCDAPRAEAVADSGRPILEDAVARAPWVELVDLTETFCNAEICAAVVGGTVVMRDEHHFSATFARTLAPWLGHEIDARRLL